MQNALTRDFNYLQNEEVMVELDDAKDKATEVLKRMLHTQKVRHEIQRIISYPTCNCTVLYVLFWCGEYGMAVHNNI
jgi:hypothetical protein